MAIHDDIAASLPDPPPPAPARRTAAIEQALRRFDGTAAPPATAPSAEPRSRPWLSPSGRRYAGALASIVLVALIGAPLAWQTLRDAPAPERDEPIAATAPPVRPEPRVPEASMGPIVASRDRRSSGSGAEPAIEAGVADAVADRAPVVFAEAAPPPPPAPMRQRAAPPSAPDRSSSAESSATPREEIMVSGSRIAAPAMAPPASVSAADSDNRTIVATGARARAPRGDWNECTIDDPGRSLARCRHLVDPAAKGTAGRAAAHLADGLRLAWQGETAEAITAFDRAIAIAPSSFAYLNRGVAHRRNGDLDRALADLDRAVRADPRSARAYYNRSQVLRQQGADARAEADEKRAVSLDPRYTVVIE